MFNIDTTEDDTIEHSYSKQEVAYYSTSTSINSGSLPGLVEMYIQVDRQLKSIENSDINLLVSVSETPRDKFIESVNELLNNEKLEDMSMYIEY